ncbi:MAG: PH domain-containing protein [Synergistaceae bacterium]|jgi:hypothetical protein|nr:PH domain-containing protein [Synergistaceae bacterium]
MSIDLKQIKAQSKSKYLDLKPKELTLLTEKLLPGETLITVFQCQINDVYHRIVLSNMRIFIFRSAMFRAPIVTEIHFEDINYAEGNIGFFFGNIDLTATSGHYQMTTVPKAEVNTFVSFVKDRVAEVKQRPQKDTSIDELERLFNLKEKGALTEEEYVNRKEQLLNTNSLPQSSVMSSSLEITEPLKKKQPKKKIDFWGILCVTAVVIIIVNIFGKEKLQKNSQPQKAEPIKTAQPAAPSVGKTNNSHVYVDLNSGNEVPSATPNESFQPVYSIKEIEDTSVARAKRLSALVVVPDGLDRETLRKNMVHAAEKIMDESGAKAVSVYARRASDETNTGFSAALCTLAPFGEIGKAIDPTTTRKDMRAVVDFDESYFQKLDESKFVTRIDEKTRREIYRAGAAAEYNARMDARRQMIKKYMHKEPKKNASEDELLALMNQIYMTIHDRSVLEEETILTTKKQENYEKQVMKKYKLTEDEYDNIGTEGSLKYWRLE